MSDSNATNIETQTGSKGLEAAGGIEGALAKEREYRGDKKDQENTDEEHGKGVGAAN
ncbi:hypothetical protein [Phaffia rhodozyma]|uniref:Uncharacterized protein n=1 Tax=Phaffia rhodozyma TaxID=264483 RepID=A0A0F7SK65_PHARH|nr:hypothetical protein [Phaffia rhodozyma]